MGQDMIVNKEHKRKIIERKVTAAAWQLFKEDQPCPHLCPAPAAAYLPDEGWAEDEHRPGEAGQLRAAGEDSELLRAAQPPGSLGSGGLLVPPPLQTLVTAGQPLHTAGGGRAAADR